MQTNNLSTYSMDLAEQYLEDYFPAHQANEYLYKMGNTSFNITPYTQTNTNEKRARASQPLEENKQAKVEKQIEIAIFPNPTKGTFTVQYPSDTFDKLVLLSLQGQVIVNNSLNANTTSKTLQLNHLAKGVYFILLTGDNVSSINKKIVVR